VEFYDTTGKKSDADRWRKELEQQKPAVKQQGGKS
jgi:hypothetical protein